MSETLSFIKEDGRDYKFTIIKDEINVEKIGEYISIIEKSIASYEGELLRLNNELNELKKLQNVKKVSI